MTAVAGWNLDQPGWTIVFSTCINRAVNRLRPRVFLFEAECRFASVAITGRPFIRRNFEWQIKRIGFVVLITFGLFGITVDDDISGMLQITEGLQDRIVRIQTPFL
jgi:hypothetical protein